MICGQCGDPLVKTPFVKPTQIFALVSATTFIAPLLLMVHAHLKDLNSPQFQRGSDSIALEILTK